MKHFYDWSGGMESSAMLIVDRERIKDTAAVVRWVNTGKQFPEMLASKRQIERLLDLEIVTVPLRIRFSKRVAEYRAAEKAGAYSVSRESGAVRRASLDLTRALADLRKHNR